MLYNPKHVSNIPSYAAIINIIFARSTWKKETKKTDDMEIKYKLVLYGMNWEAADVIEYNTIGVFNNRDSNTPGYYIVWWTGNSYTLQERYTWHAFDPQVLIPEGELVCPDKFMTTTRKLPIDITS